MKEVRSVMLAVFGLDQIQWHQHNAHGITIREERKDQHSRYEHSGKPATNRQQGKTRMESRQGLLEHASTSHNIQRFERRHPSKRAGEDFREHAGV